jgi:hypothetical protein
MVSRYFVYKQALLREAERLVQAHVLREKEDIFVTVQVPVGVLRWLGRKLVVCRELCMCDGCRRYCGAAEL